MNVRPFLRRRKHQHARRPDRLYLFGVCACGYVFTEPHPSQVAQ